MKKRIVQLIPSLAPRDAVGNHTLALSELLEEMGFRNSIVADEIYPEVADRAEPFSRYQLHPEKPSLYIYQASTNSRIASWLYSNRPPVSINYHNITPWRQVASFEPEVAQVLKRAIGETGRLHQVSRSAFTFSNFNGRDLRRLGYRTCSIVPPLIKLTDKPIEPSLGSARWLFIGRIFPNKNQVLILASFKVYRDLYDSSARLTLVGSTSSKTYEQTVTRTIEQLGIGDSVTLASGLSDTELAAVWARANVYVSASLHEGYGFPLVEAMAYGVPVVALSRGAVAETVGNAALVLDSEDPVKMAATVHLLISNTSLYNRIREAGFERVKDQFNPSKVREAYARVISEALS
jgi:glycosyltransferase involved in cell wall biosynthesis